MPYPTNQYDQFNIGSMSADPNQLPTYLAQAMQDYQTGVPSQSGLPSYLSYDMGNPQAPQPPQTPVAQAMAPQSPAQTAMAQAMAPQGPGMSPIQSMFQRQTTDPNMARSNALIAAGSALMGGDNLQMGMAAAGQAFNDTFDKTLNQQRDLNTPRVTPVADGSFSMVQLPGQAPQVLPNGQVQDFLMGKQMLAGRLALQKDVFTANLNAQRDQEKNDRAQAATYGPKLQVTNQAIATTQAALAEARRQADQEPVWAKLQGTFPGAANFFGTDAAQGNNLIQNALVDTQLAQDAQKSGAITDQQAKMLGADVPSISSSRATVLVPFLERRLEALQRYQSYQQSQANKANPVPTQGFVAGAGNSGGILSSKAGTSAPSRGNGMSYVQ